MPKIFLIGFMGSGKTTVGKQLALLLHADFIDLDKLIEEKEQASISTIFERNGEQYFRERESFFLKSLAASGDVVIATGGGTPCFFDNMEWMNDNGVTIYLKATPKLLSDRLRKERDHRPLLRGRSDEEVLDFIHQKLSEREKFYATAQVVVGAVSLTGKKLLDALHEFL